MIYQSTYICVSIYLYIFVNLSICIYLNIYLSVYIYLCIYLGITKQQRLDIEKLMMSALSKLTEDLSGKYHPLDNMEANYSYCLKIFFISKFLLSKYLSFLNFFNCLSLEIKFEIFINL